MWKDVFKVLKSDSILNAATSETLNMLTKTYGMFEKSTDVLRNKGAVSIQEKMRKKDRKINKKMIDVRRKVLIHLSSNPSDFDLSSSLTLLNIVVDIERIGDYTKNISDLVFYRELPLQDSLFEKPLDKIEKGIRKVFQATLDSLENYDSEKAIKLLDEYGWINSTCEENISLLVKGECKRLSKSDIASFALYFRWLKRINAHLRNILTTIVNPFDKIGFAHKAEVEASLETVDVKG